MSNFYKVFVITTVATIVSACATDPNTNNMRLHTSKAYQSTIAVKVSEKEQVLGIVKNFATSVACSTSFDQDALVKTTVDDVFLVNTSNLGHPEDHDFNSEYLVYWSGDIGCSGGMGDDNSFMTSVNRFSDTRPFLIETGFGSDSVPQDKFFSDLGIYSRFVNEVNYKNGIFSIVSGHDNGDGTDGWIGNNSPRYQYRYSVKSDTSGEWKVVDKQLLEDLKE